MIINNLEFDHADIYDSIDDILWQFHQLMRTVPGNGRIVINGNDDNVAKVIEQGCWTAVERFSSVGKADWSAEFVDRGERHIRISGPDQSVVEGLWRLGGGHNLENAVAAVAAARSAGIEPRAAIDALSRFEGVKRRMERTATVEEIAIYDDFAHHPTAIRRSIAGLRNRFPGKRIVVALEPRSNTMKMGVHRDSLAPSLEAADLVFVYRPTDMKDVLDDSLNSLAGKLRLFDSYDDLVADLNERLRPGDQVVFMSNGGFGASRQKLTLALQNRR